MGAIAVAVEKAPSKCPFRMLRIRVRRAAGFALGVAALVLLDLRFCVWPRLTGRAGRNR